MSKLKYASMKHTNQIKKNCNVYFPRSNYSLFIILSNESKSDDNFVIINNFNLEKIPNEIITLLKKKNFKIIFIKKDYSMRTSNVSKNNIVKKFLVISFLINLKNISSQILKIDYAELSEINFNYYNKINIYYSSNMFYFCNLYKKFNNINLYFLEHGSGNFLTMLYENYKYIYDYKYFFKKIFTMIFFKIRGISLPSNSYYYGISGHIFNTQKLINNNHVIKFINSNYKKGFDQVFNFYKSKLREIKKKNCEYVYLQLPHVYHFHTFQKFLEIVVKKVRNKKNFIFLIKLKAKHTNKQNIYSKYVKRYLKKEKINYCFLNEKFRIVPAEVVIKFFKVKEIYSAYSTTLFSSYYFCNRKIKINAFFSSLVKKKFQNFLELSPLINKFVQKKYINKKVNYIKLN